MSDLRAKLIEEFLEDEEYAYAYYNDFLNMYIATQLKVLREQRGFKTQTEFANASGIPQEQISQHEDIDRNSWTISTLRKFARALGVNVRVSFESFSNSIETMVNFRRETLQRPERIEDLARFAAAPQKAHQDLTPSNLVLLDAYHNAITASRLPKLPETGSILQETHLSKMQREKPPYETADDQPSESDLAIPPGGPQSARESLRENRIT